MSEERIKESDSSQPSVVARFAQASCKELLVPQLSDSLISMIVRSISMYKCGELSGQLKELVLNRKLKGACFEWLFKCLKLPDLRLCQQICSVPRQRIDDICRQRQPSPSAHSKSNYVGEQIKSRFFWISNRRNYIDRQHKNIHTFKTARTSHSIEDVVCGPVLQLSRTGGGRETGYYSLKMKYVNRYLKKWLHIKTQSEEGSRSIDEKLETFKQKCNHSNNSHSI